MVDPYSVMIRSYNLLSVEKNLLILKSHICQFRVTRSFFLGVNTTHSLRSGFLVVEKAYRYTQF